MANGVTNLTDEELDRVAGGSETTTTKISKYQVGDHVEVKCTRAFFFEGTKGATVTKVVFAKMYTDTNGEDVYDVFYHVRYDDGTTDVVDVDKIE